MNHRNAVVFRPVYEHDRMIRLLSNQTLPDVGPGSFNVGTFALLFDFCFPSLFSALSYYYVRSSLEPHVTM